MTVKDIICYKTNYGDIYRLDDVLTGQILEKENKTFEGIITDYDQNSTYFVFGKINDKGIELIKTTTAEKEFPRMYKVEKDGLNYYGDLFAKTVFVELPIGECKIVISDSEVYREVTKKEIKHLEKLISFYKENMNKESQKLYKNSQQELSKVYKKSLQK